VWLHHSLFIVCISLAWKVLVIHPHICQTLLHTVSIWSVKLRMSLSLIPRSLTHWVYSIILLFGPKYEVEFFMSWFLPYRSSSNLFSLNCMLFICCHLYIVLRLIMMLGCYCLYTKERSAGSGILLSLKPASTRSGI